MNNEELTKKLDELLKEVKKMKGADEVSKEEKRNDMKKLVNSITEDIKDEETVCAIYASNNGIGLSGQGYELATLLTTVIEEMLSREIIEESELKTAVKLAIGYSRAKKNDNLAEFTEEKIEEIFNKVGEMLDNI